MTESTQETLILTSWDAVAAFYGVGRDTVRKAWKSRGMPCQPGSGGADGYYDIREISRWLAERLRNAGAWEEPGRDGSGETEWERERRYLGELAGMIDAGDWRGALVRMLNRFPLEVAAFADLACEIWCVLGWPGEMWDPPIGGSQAVRFTGTKRYVWVGLGIDFAQAVCTLVNSRAVWLVPPTCLEFDENHWKPDLPTDGTGDVWDRWVLSVNPEHRSDASTEIIETVTKPRITLMDERWEDRQEG